MNATRDRFLSKLSIHPNGCIVWTGTRTRDGYGRFKIRRANVQTAHRSAWVLYRGNFTQGLVLDHVCRNRACVNPYHLEEVTSAENTKRGAQATKTHCKHGHSNWGRESYRGTRLCRECARIATAKYNLKLRAALAKAGA